MLSAWRTCFQQGKFNLDSEGDRLIQTFEQVREGRVQEDTQEKLLAAAGKLFCERGYAATSVRDIVSEAGVNLGSVNYHFGGKENLYAAMISRKIEPMKRLGAEIASSGCTSAAEKLKLLLEEYAVHVLHRDPGLKVIFTELLSGGSNLPDEVKNAVRFRNSLFVSIVQEGIEGGEFREFEIESASWMFFGMLSSYILFHSLIVEEEAHSPYPDIDARGIARLAADIFINGIRTDATL